MSNKLELTHSLSAEAEKKLAVHKKNIRAYANGVDRSGAQLFGYAFLAGNEMNLAADILPHGQLLAWIENSFPDLSNGTVGRWRNFADTVKAKFPTVGNLKPLQLKKKFSKVEQEEILKAIPQIMDGQGMVEFMRSCKLLNEPKPIGGDTRQTLPDGSHPPAPPRKPNAQEQAQAADETVRVIYGGYLKTLIEDRENFILCKLSAINELEDLRLALGRKIEAVKKERKP